MQEDTSTKANATHTGNQQRFSRQAWVSGSASSQLKTTEAASEHSTTHTDPANLKTVLHIRFIKVLKQSILIVLGLAGLQLKVGIMIVGVQVKQSIMTVLDFEELQTKPGNITAPGMAGPQLTGAQHLRHGRVHKIQTQDVQHTTWTGILVSQHGH
jgi:hypothetical protein